MGLYLENGYFNFGHILKYNVPFVFVVGGRGTGKTYGALKWLRENNICFLLLRRTQTQAEMLSRDDTNPFRSIDRDIGTCTVIRPLNKQMSAFYNGEKNEDGGLDPAGAPLGYLAALSTISNIRGFDGSSIKVIIYDEFIPELHERSMRGEYDAWLNVYETVNRNRELTGDPPVRMFMLANSNNIYNPLMLGSGLTDTAVFMAENDTEVTVDYERGSALIMLRDSQISRKKKDTALYRFAGSGRFADMALKNAFGYDAHRLKRPPLKEWSPIVVFGDICFYRHKANRNMFHASRIVSGSPARYPDDPNNRTRFIRDYGFLWLAYLEDHLTYDDLSIDAVLTDVFK